MKKLLFLIMLSVILLSCGEKGLSSGNATKGKGTAGAPVVPPNVREAQILTTNYWIIEHYISSTDFENGRANRGRWFLFKKDGTFECGHWEEKTSSGSWYLTLGGKNPVLTIDSFKDAEDSAWEMQGIPDDASEMSWVGSANYPSYGDLTKMLNLLTPPTKKQFGDE
jgi:hypothetical protein